MSFGPITDRMRRPIPKVTERRGGGHAIELSHVRPDSIGTGCDRQYDWWSRSTQVDQWDRPGPFFSRRLTARQLADTVIAEPLWPLIARPIGQRLNSPSNTPACPPFPARQLATLMPAEQPFETHLPYPLQHLHPDPPAPLFRMLFKTGSRATRTKQFTSRCTLCAPNFSNRIDDLVAELPPAY